ncbi:nuclear transport factor 2 family protein [Trichocoleus desertorum AS-A10]|uniref:nuclear transport factor 2 family protein n=1 Tax=Trichocoleus desertorum TaxID=1481672 RepID=UPI003299AC97
MHNSLTGLCRNLQPNSRHIRAKAGTWPLLGLLTLGLTVFAGEGVQPVAVQAQTRPVAPATTTPAAPAPLKNLLAQIDAAANSHNLSEVMKFYGSNFSHSDGLTRQGVEKALAALWKQYPQINYRTELKSWKAEGRGFTAETVTYMSGVQQLGERNLVLNTTLRSRQRLENQKIVRQEVLAEETQLTTGEAPPRVEITLPEQVRPNQEYSFDAIVREPLGDSLLLGAAVEEPIKPNNYLNPATFNLELLSAGGIYKVGRAPARPEDRWISAVLVREDGMTIVTQRLRVVGQPVAAQPPKPSR